MFTYLVQTVNNMSQNVSGKSIENQELILSVFFAVRNIRFCLFFFKPTSDECIVALCMPGIWP